MCHPFRQLSIQQIPIQTKSVHVLLLLCVRHQSDASSLQSPPSSPTDNPPPPVEKFRASSKNFQSLGPFILYSVSYSSLIKAQGPWFQAFNCFMSRKDLPVYQ